MNFLSRFGNRVGRGLLSREPVQPVATEAPVTHSFFDGVPHLFDMGHKPKNLIAPVKHPMFRNPITR